MRLHPLPAGLVAAVLIGACGDPSPGPTAQSTPLPTPDVQATVEAEVEARLRSRIPPTPTAVPLSVASRQAIADFAADHRKLIGDWDQFRTSFESWRQGLVSCDAGSVQVALMGFAAATGDIAERARALPRSGGVRELADKLIAATEQESEAVRGLRDTWHPDTSTSVFEPVDTERSRTQALRREVDDALRDLQMRTSPESQALVAAFRLAVEELNSDWDAFRRSYDSFRSQEAELASSDMITRLGQLVDQLRGIVIAVRELPADDTTAEVSALLAEAAEAEDLALRNLRGTFQRLEPSEEQQGPAPVSMSESTGSSQEPSSRDAVTFKPRDIELFDAFDSQLADGNTLRRRAVLMLAGLVEETGEDAQAATEQFAQQYGLVLDQWDSFHSGYDEWRLTEGGCDRSKAAETLGRFTTEFAALTRRAREMSGATVLGPLRELLVEAAEIEEGGLRDLRGSWRPFDSEVYTAHEGRRASAARLLRQVATGLQNLLDQHDIAAPAE